MPQTRHLTGAIVYIALGIGLVATPTSAWALDKRPVRPMAPQTIQKKSAQQKKAAWQKAQRALRQNITAVFESAFPFTQGPPGKRVTFSRPQVRYVSNTSTKIGVRVKYRKTRGIPQYTASGKGEMKARVSWHLPQTACVSQVQLTKVDLKNVNALLDKHVFKAELNKQLRTICLDKKGQLCFDPKKPPRDKNDPLYYLKLDAYKHPEKYARPVFCVVTAQASSRR